MLQKISIKNLGLVEEEEIQFFDGFTVITGETGSGKSFFCNAIQLGMGERAKNVNTLSFLKNTENTEKIEKIENKRTVIELELNNTVLRRVIEKNKSRFFIDDIPENLKGVQEFSKQYFHMHSQHDNIFLKQPEAATEIFDASLENKNSKTEYSQVFKKYSERTLELEKIEQVLEKQLLQKDFWEFQSEKLEKVVFSKEALEQAENTVKISNFSVDTKEQVEELIAILAGEGESVLSLLDRAEDKISGIYNEKNNNSEKNIFVSEKIKSIFSTVQGVVIDLEDELPDSSNEQEIIIAQDYIQKITRWCKEFSVISPDQLLEKKEVLYQNLQKIEELEELKNTKNREKDALLQKLEQCAEILSRERQKKVENFGALIEEKCKKMGMEKAQFCVYLKPVELCKYGKEQVQFLFSANQNQPQNLSLSASGGEIARITLALKQFFPENITMIFDEIDTGVSGNIAEKMATEMQNLSHSRQIISITHLPQIAAMADHHLVVEKKHLEKKTITTLRYVEGEERVEVIANMLSGEVVSTEARVAAKKLLQIA